VLQSIFTVKSAVESTVLVPNGSIFAMIWHRFEAFYAGKYRGGTAL
jgi:hypothetical protein